MKTTVSLGGAERQRNTGSARSSRARSALHEKLRELDRKIAFTELQAKSWAWCTLKSKRHYMDKLQKLDQRRKEVRHLLKSPRHDNHTA